MTASRRSPGHEPGDWEQKVLHTFMDGDTITAIPPVTRSGSCS